MSLYYTKTRWTLAALIGMFLAFMLGSGPARAHAFLEHASPAVGSTLYQPPNQVNLKFSEPLEPAFSSLEVVDQAGRRVDKGDAKVDASDATVLTASLKPLPPGTYKVIWRVVSIDTHATDGDYTFRVE
jgi:methionine-rich copper-binding protein CopC